MVKEWPELTEANWREMKHKRAHTWKCIQYSSRSRRMRENWLCQVLTCTQCSECCDREAQEGILMRSKYNNEMSSNIQMSQNSNIQMRRNNNVESEMSMNSILKWIRITVYQKWRCYRVTLAMALFDSLRTRKMGNSDFRIYKPCKASTDNFGSYRQK